jgi:hypothetical protein
MSANLGCIQRSDNLIVKEVDMESKVITFDELQPGSFPPSYAGFTWSGQLMVGNDGINTFLTAINDFTPGPVHTSDITMKTNSLFDLVGMFIASTGTYPDTYITVEGWVGSNKKYSQPSILIKETKFKFFNFNFMDVDTVTINSAQEVIRIDNIFICGLKKPKPPVLHVG